MSTLPVFPTDIAIKYGSTKVMSWETQVKRSGANKIRTNTRYKYPRWRISVTAINLTNEDVRRVQGFFASLRGGHRPFLWRDHEDHHEEDIRLGTGDDFNKVFYLVRQLGGFQEPVLDIVPDTLHVFVDGMETPVTVGNHGAISFTVAPRGGAVITATFDYYWRVILEKDEFQISAKYTNYNESKSFTMGVVR